MFSSNGERQRRKFAREFKLDAVRMVALASDETKQSRLVRDVQHHALRVVEIENEREVFGEDEIDDLDDHLAANFRAVEPLKQTAWDTIATRAKPKHEV